MNDPEIIALYFDRREAAVSETKRKYGAYIRSIAGRILRDERDAEEAVSDAYLKAWESIPPQRPESLGAYMGRLCRNAALDRAKRNSREKRGGGEYELVLGEIEEIAGADTPEKAAESRAFSEALNGFLEGLPKKKRAIFVQRYWYLLSVREIAAEQTMSEAAVKMQLSRMRTGLKEVLLKEGLYYE